MATVPVVVTSPPTNPTQKDGAPMPSHHLPSGKGFKNPWPSAKEVSVGPMTIFNMRYRDWVNHPVPPPESLPQIVTPDWGFKPNATDSEKTEARRKIKSTWLGHACFLVEFPAPEGSTGRGARILFDPVFSQRCSPVQFMGPARVTQPPIALQDLPEVDAVVLSHNHYDHTDVATLKHVYSAQAKGTVHFFAPLGNAKWFRSLGFSDDHVTELDWWHARDLSVSLPGKGGDAKADLRITCTPCQHFTGRTLTDRYETLWASWAVQQLPSAGSPTAKPGSVWFGGDTGYKSVERGATTEEGLPTCPVFKEIGEKFGGFDLSMIPIGAYDPRWFMSRVHCSPEDSVELHIETKSRRSIGMHWATWILTCEEMTEPPKRLRAACERRGVPAGEFDVCNIGETILVSPAPL